MPPTPKCTGLEAENVETAEVEDAFNEAGVDQQTKNEAVASSKGQ